MQTINVSVTVDETNLILEALGAMPFARVYELVDKIQRQAQEQIDGPPAADGLRIEEPSDE